MHHNLEIDGMAFRLRPVALEDAGFILELRSDPERSRYLHRGAADTASQEQWLRMYFKTPGDYYFVIENRSTGLREGTAGIYNFNDVRRDAEWGRWILRKGLARGARKCQHSSTAWDSRPYVWITSIAGPL